MKPSAPRTLVNFAQILRTDFAPQLQSFSAGNAGMIANMLDMIAEDWDRAADRLVKENAEIRAVLKAIAPEADTDRLDRLTELTGEAPEPRLLDVPDQPMPPTG